MREGGRERKGGGEREGRRERGKIVRKGPPTPELKKLHEL